MAETYRYRQHKQNCILNNPTTFLDSLRSLEASGINKPKQVKQILCCLSEFFGGTLARKAHHIGEGINKTKAGTCSNPNLSLVAEIKAEVKALNGRKAAEKRKATLSLYKGPFFVQCTNALGRYKITENVAADIRSAIDVIGKENVFILCMDGACKAVLKLISNEMPKVFGQRCSTHGCNLLMKDIGKQFVWEIKWCMRLLYFICNHDAIYALLHEMDEEKNSLTVCQVRYAVQLYSVDRIVKDRAPLERLFTSQKLLLVLDRPSTHKAELLEEYWQLRAGFILCEQTWERLEVLSKVETPL